MNEGYKRATGVQPRGTTEPARTRGADWEGLVTLDEAARRLSCTKAAVRKWISQGRLTAVKVGRLTRVRSRDIAQVVEHGLPERIA